MKAFVLYCLVLFLEIEVDVPEQLEGRNAQMSYFEGCAAEAAMICHESRDKINTYFLKQRKLAEIYFEGRGFWGSARRFYICTSCIARLGKLLAARMSGSRAKI